MKQEHQLLSESSSLFNLNTERIRRVIFEEDMAILKNIIFGIVIGFIIGVFSGEPLEAKVVRPTPKKPSSVTSSIAFKLRELPQKIDTLNLNDSLTGTGEVFSKIQESVQWFKKLRQELKKNKARDTLETLGAQDTQRTSR